MILQRLISDNIGGGKTRRYKSYAYSENTLEQVWGTDNRQSKTIATDGFTNVRAAYQRTVDNYSAPTQRP